MVFHVGQQVVCIKDGWDDFFAEYQINTYPVVKGVYTIYGIIDNRIGELNHRGQVIRTSLLMFDEIYFTNTSDIRPSFRADHFRPVKTTSIEIFEKIIQTPPKRLIRETETELQ